MPGCPSPSELEDVAAGLAPAAGVAAHIAGCAACRASIEEVRANQRFAASARPAIAAAFKERGDDSSLGLASALPPPGSVPGYELVEEVGRGGQGIVYRAFHTVTRRPAAVKMLLAGAFASGDQRRRFKREIEIAAGLRHPSIVSVFDAGATNDGRRYVAMEFVTGTSLDRFVRERWPLKRRDGRGRINQIMKLMWSVADGVGFAHANGVQHRDIKPSNILVDAEGRPRVLDFGLARSSEGATLTHDFAGTPAYAAPEQFSSNGQPVGTRTDVYALGLVMYIALTEAHPYPCDGSIADVIRHAVTTPPTPPSHFTPRLPRDVETIVLKCLSKEPARRYATAGELAADIDDYLNGRPISARRDSTIYVLRRMAMKHRLPTAALAVVLLTVVGAAVVLALLARDLDQARGYAVASLSESNVQRARMMTTAGDIGQAESLLWTEALPAGMRTDGPMLTAGTPESLRSAWSLAELYARLPVRFRAHRDHRLSYVGLNPLTRQLWAFDNRGSRTTWSLDGQLIAETPAFIPADPATQMVVARNGRHAVCRVGDALVACDIDSGTVTALPAAWAGDSTLSDLSDDGMRLVSTGGASGAIRVFDIQSRAPAGTFAAGYLNAHFATIAGNQLVVGGTRGNPKPSIDLWQAPDWELRRTLRVPGEYGSNWRDNTLVVRRVSSNGRWAAAGIQGRVVLVDLQAGPSAQPPVADLGTIITCACFDDSAAALFVGLADGAIVMLEVPTLRVVRSLLNGFIPHGLAAGKTPDVLIVSDADQRVSVYETDDRPWLEKIAAAEPTAQAVAVAEDGTVAWSDDAGDLHIRAAAPPHPVLVTRANEAKITSVAFSPNGLQVLTAAEDGVIRV